MAVVNVPNLKMGILRLGTIQTLDEWFTHTGGKTNLNLFNPRSRSLCVSSLLFLSFLLSLPSSLFHIGINPMTPPPLHISGQENGLLGLVQTSQYSHIDSALTKQGVG